MKMFQVAQRESLDLCAHASRNVVSSLALADALAVSEGAARHRLVRYARKGWLERWHAGNGWSYQITSRGRARLSWLEELSRKQSILETLGDTLR